MTSWLYLRAEHALRTVATHGAAGEMCRMCQEYYPERAEEDGSAVWPRRSDDNERQAAALYETGKMRNLSLSFHACAQHGARVYCYIQLPIDREEADRLLLNSSYLKFSIRSPLREAKPQEVKRRCID